MKDLFLNVYIKLQMLMDREDGQDMIEYALVAALVALGAVAGAQGLAHGLNTAYVNLASRFTAIVG